MFTKLLNSIRDSITRGSDNSTSDNNNNTEKQENNSNADIRRRPSVTGEIIQNNDTHNVFSAQPLPAERLGRNHSISVSRPIAINDSKVGGKPRRDSTLFGISNVTADDYVQKDLISSSWS
ncbi:hypothetical protein BDF21DRAFT_418969 [Thamnidium elegans]|nr:hypothetical protein BDF21DRAFT_418969 [Thamnidium elegans]